MSNFIFSVIIPAYNEEKYIGKCIEAVKRASEKIGEDKVQIIVSANRCTDNTVEIARAMGAEVCENTIMGGMFWCYRKGFEDIGGFDETLVSLEDMDFAIRLKQLGDKRGQKYGVLKRSRIITSSRKFDEFGDWYLIKNKKLTKAIFTGSDREAADKFYYDVKR